MSTRVLSLAMEGASVPRDGLVLLTSILGVTLDFNAKVGRPIGIRRLQDFNGVRGFGLHPINTPCAGMSCLVRARNVANAPTLAIR